MIEAGGRRHSQIYRRRECAVGPFIAARKPKNVGGTVVPSRTLLIHSAFTAVFAVMAVFAIATASGTTSAWFTPAVSSQAYAASLIGAVVVAIALATAAVGHLGRLEDARRGIALRIAGMPEAGLLPLGEATLVTAEAIKMMPPSDEEVDDLLTALATPVPGAPPGMEIEITGTLVEVSAALTAARTRKELMKALLIERARVEEAREAAAPSIAGPIIVALLFASAAGAMLPGSDGFAASHFQLNTGLILFLGYGWMFLVLWAVLALAMLTARSSPDGQKMVRSGK